MKAKELGTLVWKALQAYTVPLGLLTLAFKLQDQLPWWALTLLGIGLVAFIFYSVKKRNDVNKRLQKTVSLYETVLRSQSVAPEDIDQHFEYEQIHTRMLVSRPDAKVEHILRIKNAATLNKDCVSRLISGDAPIDFEHLCFNAWFDTGYGEKKAAVEPAPLYNGTQYRVRMKLNGAVISPGALATLRYGCQWPGAVARNEDYWVFSVKECARTVGQLRAEVCFAEPPAYYQFLELGEDEGFPRNVTGPETVEIDGKTWHLYRCIIVNPKGIYLANWRLT